VYTKGLSIVHVVQDMMPMRHDAEVTRDMKSHSFSNNSGTQRWHYIHMYYSHSDIAINDLYNGWVAIDGLEACCSLYRLLMTTEGIRGAKNSELEF